MTSAVEICNDALAMVGHEPFISSLSQAGKTAGLCNIYYARSRDEVLRGHPWNFAMKRVALSAETDTPVWDFAYRYILPTDCLRVWKVDAWDSLTRWKVEGDAIVTDLTAPLNILYISRVEDPALFDASFVRVLAARIAGDLAMPLTNSMPMRQAMLEEFKQRLREARTNNGQEGQPDRLWSDIFTEARR